MKNLKAKLNKKSGFTLIEMLIVVAIIAILIAISIPVVNKALERARDAVDTANMRSAAALAEIEYLTDETVATSGGTFYYQVADAKTEGSQGKLVDSASDATFGQCKGTDGCTFTDTDKGHTAKVIKVVIATDGQVTVSWEAKSGT